MHPSFHFVSVLDASPEEAKICDKSCGNSISYFAFFIVYCLPSSSLSESSVWVFQSWKDGNLRYWQDREPGCTTVVPILLWNFNPFPLPPLLKTKTQKTKKDNDNDRFQNDEFTRGSSLSIKRIKCKVSYFSILSIDHFLKDTFFVIMLKMLKYQKTKIQINHCM